MKYFTSSFLKKRKDYHIIFSHKILLFFFCTSNTRHNTFWKMEISTRLFFLAPFCCLFLFFVCFNFSIPLSLSLNIIYFEKNIAAKYVSVYCAHPKKKKLPILLKEKELNDTFKKTNKTLYIKKIDLKV